MLGPRGRAFGEASGAGRYGLVKPPSMAYGDW